MRSVLFRRILAVLAVLAVLLPAAALSEWSEPDPLCDTPWWEVNPPRPRTRVVYRQAETLVATVPAEGWAYTSIRSVNVRCMPSTYATKVASVKSKGTEIAVTARVKNSAGEIWYAVQLENGTLGYIRSDLLDLSNVVLIEETEPAATPTPIIYQGSFQPDPTPQVIYVTPETRPTPTPLIIYLPAAETEEGGETMTPEIVFATPEPPSASGDG